MITQHLVDDIIFSTRFSLKNEVRSRIFLRRIDRMVTITGERNRVIEISFKNQVNIT